MHTTPGGGASRLFRVAHAGAHSAARGQDFPPHSHYGWELTYYRSGHIRAPLGDEVFETMPGMLLLTPPATVHAELALTAYANYYINIEPIEPGERIEAAGAAGAVLPWPRMLLDDGERTLERVCAALAEEWKRPGERHEELAALLLGQLDILIRRAQQRQPWTPAERIVRDAERLIDERFAEPLTIAAVADELGVPGSTLRASFARVRHYAPLAYLRQARARRALTLLQTSTLTLEAIARLCGYDSASHLSRHIKRATGKRPGALRGR